MARIPYPDLSMITDDEVTAIMDRAANVGTPRPESQALRAHVPAVLKTFTATWMETFVSGVVEHELKELCRVYVTTSVKCGYCAAQRSEDAGVDEDHYEDLLMFEKSDRYSEREKAALAYTDSIVWDAALATDDVWARLDQNFTSAELVELGYFVALTSGQQRWLKTLNIGHRELLDKSDAGLRQVASE